MTRFTRAFGTSLILTCMMTGISCAAGGGLREIPISWPIKLSDQYSVKINGMPVSPMRCDGREGPVSYVHLIWRSPGRIDITCPAADGQWDVSPVRPLPDLTSGKANCSFTLREPNKMMIVTAAKEKLFIIAHAHDPNVPKPSDPNVISILDRGARGRGEKLLTAEIQQAIDELGSRPNGGTLLLPSGFYRSGTIEMRSKVTLYLDAGALLIGSENPSDYPFDPGTEETPDRTQDIRSRLILFDSVQNAAIRGHGEIDGMGQIIRAKERRVPNLIRVRGSRNILIEGVTLRRSAGWNTHIFHSNNVTVRDVTIFSTWSDGIDPDNSSNVAIEESLIASYDDSLAIKSTFFAGTAETVRNIRMKNCVVWTDASALKIGTETKARTMENISIENVIVAGGDRGIATYIRDGAVVRNVKYDDILIKNVKQAVIFEIKDRQGGGVLKNVALDDVAVVEPTSSFLRGMDEDHQISDIRFRNFTLGGQKVLSFPQGRFEVKDHVENVQFFK